MKRVTKSDIDSVVESIGGWRPESDGAECFRCPLRGKSLPVAGEGPVAPVVAIIGEGPGRNEIDAGRPFVGKSGELLENMLAGFNLYRPAVYLDNATCCMPPGGDLEAYLKKEKKEQKEIGLSWNSPVDCCRERLFRRLGVPKCARCMQYELGPESSRCACERPLMARSTIRKCPRVVIPVGNAALQSLTGLTGIMNWRGSPLRFGKPY